MSDDVVDVFNQSQTHIGLLSPLKKSVTPNGSTEKLNFVPIKPIHSR